MKRRSFIQSLPALPLIAGPASTATKARALASNMLHGQGSSMFLRQHLIPHSTGNARQPEVASHVPGRNRIPASSLAWRS